MRFLTTGLGAALTLSIVLAGLVLAGSPHFEGEPVARDQGTALQVSGTLDGLGRADVMIHVRASGTATVTCVRPEGNDSGATTGETRKIGVAVYGTQNLPAVQVADGSSTFSVVTAQPAVTTKSAGCARGAEPRLEDVAFTSATIRVFQNDLVVASRTIKIP